MSPQQKDRSPPQQILHVVGELDGYGLTRQLELLVVEQLSAGRHIQVVAFTATREAITTLHRQGVDCRVLNRRWRRDPFVAVRLAQEIWRQPPDLLHLWGQSALDYFRSIRRFVRSTPTLTSLPHQRNGIAPGVTLPNPSSLSLQEFLAEQLLSEDSILIAVAGPLTREQQIDEAIWYFELVRTLDERVRLLIFGDGPDRHRLERFSRLASDPTAIRFLGYRTDFRELLSHADLFWQTAGRSEALPMTVLEAMAAGVPVVANDESGCCTVIDDGNNGYLVSDKDRAAFARKTLQLVQDSQLAGQIGTQAAETIADRFSVEAMTQAYAQLYHE